LPQLFLGCHSLQQQVRQHLDGSLHIADVCILLCPGQWINTVWPWTHRCSCSFQLLVFLPQLHHLQATKIVVSHALHDTVLLIKVHLRAGLVHSCSLAMLPYLLDQLGNLLFVLWA
jgi:hypothetical protein